MPDCCKCWARNAVRDRQTDARQLHRPCTTCYDGSTNKGTVWTTETYLAPKLHNHLNKLADVSKGMWAVKISSSNWSQKIPPYLKRVSTIQSNSSMQHYECVALCKDISLQRGWFCTRSLASCFPKSQLLTTCTPRSSADRSSWMFFIQVVRGGGLKMAWLAYVFSSIHARCLHYLMKF